MRPFSVRDKYCTALPTGCPKFASFEIDSRSDVADGPIIPRAAAILICADIVAIGPSPSKRSSRFFFFILTMCERIDLSSERSTIAQSTRAVA